MRKRGRLGAPGGLASGFSVEEGGGREDSRLPSLLPSGAPQIAPPMSDDSSNHAEKMKSKGGVGRIFKAMGYSIQGLAAAWRDEHAFRQELMFCVPMIAVAIALPVSLTQKALLIGTMLLIIIVELINSAVEAVVDLVTVDHHAMAGKAKDIGSAAVMICFLNAVVVWGLVLAEHYGK